MKKSGLRQVRMFLKILSFSVFICAMYSEAKGQIISEPNPNFRIDINQGCSPYKISLTDLVADKNDSVFYFFRNTLDPRNCSQDYQVNFKPCINGRAFGVKNQKTVEVDYVNASGRPEEFIIIQVNRNAPEGEQVSFLEFITTIPSVPPQIQALACGDNTVSVILDFEKDFYDYYEIEFGDGTGIRTIEKNQPNQIEHKYIIGGSFDISVKGRLDTGNDDNCSTTIVKVNTIEEAPEPRITYLEALTRYSIYLTYEPLNSTFGYTLEIDFGNGFEQVATLDPIMDNTEFTFTDTQIDNENSFYEVRIQAADNCDTRSATSPIISTIAFSHFLNDITKTFNTALSWQTSTSSFSNLKLFIHGAERAEFIRAKGDSISVALNDCLDLSDSYLVRQSNGALSKSLTVLPTITAPIELPSLSSLTAEFTSTGIIINWQDSNFPSQSYEILRKQSVNDYISLGEPTLSEWIDNQVPPSASSACYVVRYKDECGNISLMSDEVCLPLVGSLKLPNAFSPNGDHINDFFRPLDGVFKNFQMTIYNRWGLVVFETNNSEEGWNGQTNGSLGKAGTYLYRITYTDEDNIRISNSGTFALIR